MLENVKYTLGREFKFYAIIPLGQRSKGGTTITIKNEIAHKRLNIRITHQFVALEVNIYTPNRPSEIRKYERSLKAAPST